MDPVEQEIFIRKLSRIAKVTWAITAVAVVVAAGLWIGKAASADPVTPPHYATGNWQLRDWAGTYPAITTSPAVSSEVDCATETLTLEKSAGDIGTSYENTNLNLPVPVDSALLVDYEMSATANAVAGAVRMFGYGHADGDTLDEAPDFGPAIVDPATVVVSGTLEIDLLAGDTVGTFGLTYDASNDTAGSVEFSNLRLQPAQGDPITISLCVEPEPVVTATASPSPVVTTTTVTTPPVTTTTTAPATTTTVPVATTTSATCVDLNTDTRDQLISINHIGPVYADAVIAMRPFSSIDELVEVSGIGPATVAKIKASGEVCAIATLTPASGALPVTGLSTSAKVYVLIGIALMALGVFLLVGLWLRNRQARG